VQPSSPVHQFQTAYVSSPACTCSSSRCRNRRNSHFHLCLIAQHGTRQFSPLSYVSMVSPPSPCLHESGAASNSDAPTALCCSGLSPNCVHFSCCSPTASSSAVAPRVHQSACYHAHVRNTKWV